MGRVTYLLAPLFWIIAQTVTAQTDMCSVPIGTTITNSGQIGNVITGNNVSVTIIMQDQHQVYSPTAELEEYKHKLEEVLAREKLLDQKELNLLKKEEGLANRERQIVEREQNVAGQGQKISDFEKQIAYYEQEFKRLEAKSEKINPTSSAKELSEAREIVIQAREVIKSSKCLAVDYAADVKEFQDGTGQKIYGFPIEKLKNDPNYVFIGDYSGGLAVIKKFNVFGYIDNAGTVVIDYAYQDAKDFAGSVALVKKFNQWMLIDKTGKQVAVVENSPTEAKPLKSGVHLGKFGNKQALFGADGKIYSLYFDDIQQYADGIYRIKNDGKYGLMQENGTVVIPVEYDEVEPADDRGFAYLKKGIKYALMQNNALLMDAVLDKKASYLNRQKLLVVQSGKTGVYDLQVKAYALEPAFDKIEPYDNAAVMLKVFNGQQFGIFRLSSKSDKYEQVLEAQYVKMAPSTVPGLQWLRRNRSNYHINGELQGEEWYLTDADFRILNKNGFEDYRDFPDTIDIKTYPPLALVKQKGNWGAINREGKYEIKPEWQQITPFDANHTAFAQLGNKWGLIDRVGRTLIPPAYDSVRPFNAHNHALVKLNGMAGLIDRKGKVIVPFNYTDLKLYYEYGLILASTNAGGYTYEWAKCDLLIDFSGDTILNRHTLGPCGVGKRYKLTSQDKSPNLLEVVWGSTCNGTNTDFLTIGITLLHSTPTGWKSITPTPIHQWKALTKNKFLVVSDRKDTTLFSVIDYDGKVYFDKVRDFEELDADVFKLKKVEGWGLVNSSGDQLTLFKYDSIGACADGIALMTYRGKQGAVNLKSAEVVPPVFEKLAFRQADHIEIIDSNGEKYIVNRNGDCQVNCENYRKALKAYYQRKE